MASLYPNLYEKCIHENICPICMMEMAGTPKYSCENNHTVCHRCKPYYYSFPTCRYPLNIEIPPPEVPEYHMPPSIHLMPHPYPPYPPTWVDFLTLKTSICSWRIFTSFLSFQGRPECTIFGLRKTPLGSTVSTEDQELHACQFSHLGCCVHFPEHLRPIHEVRCQFRPHLEENQQPTDLDVDEGALEDCRYHSVGCNVRLPVWRKLVHEELCIYKSKLEDVDSLQSLEHVLNLDDDLEQLVDCRFKSHGCMVRMPRRRKHTHEEKCNYSKYGDELSETEYVYEPELQEDPDEQVPCCWSAYGCQVQPRRCRKEIHEEKCNYKREPCRYIDNGCSEFLEPARKFAHERVCEFAWDSRIHLAKLLVTRSEYLGRQKFIKARKNSIFNYNSNRHRYFSLILFPGTKEMTQGNFNADGEVMGTDGKKEEK